MAGIAIITVVYKNYTVLEDFMESIRKQKDTDFKLFIVDLTENAVSVADAKTSQDPGGTCEVQIQMCIRDRWPLLKKRSKTRRAEMRTISEI